MQQPINLGVGMHSPLSLLTYVQRYEIRVCFTIWSVKEVAYMHACTLTTNTLIIFTLWSTVAFMHTVLSVTGRCWITPVKSQFTPPYTCCQYKSSSHRLQLNGIYVSQLNELIHIQCDNQRHKHKLWSRKQGRWMCCSEMNGAVSLVLLLFTRVVAVLVNFPKYGIFYYVTCSNYTASVSLQANV